MRDKTFSVFVMSQIVRFVGGEPQRAAASIIPQTLSQHQVSCFSLDAKNLVQGWSVVGMWLPLTVAENLRPQGTCPLG